MKDFNGDELAERLMAERIAKVMAKYRSALKEELPAQRTARARELREIRTRCRELIKKLEDNS